MENIEADKFIKNVFEYIKKSETITDLKNIRRKAELEDKYFIDSETFYSLLERGLRKSNLILRQ